ncbi:MAG TPA: thioredoxin domain-containing protein [Longimicrobiales bacterium]|nr:thioredoxin domain-containing protein [Longimicrobiales bacterium]
MKLGFGGGLLLSAALLFGADDVAAQRREGGNSMIERAHASRQKGPQNAPVVVIEIADFQCPYCARFAQDVYPRIDSAYVKTGKVGWLFVNLPLPSHNHAWVAAEAAMCAGAVGNRFWPVHDRIFAAQASWARAADPAPTFRRFAEEAGVPMADYDACVAGDQVAGLLLQDLMWAFPRVNGTPAFIIANDQQVAGMKTFAEWRGMLDAALMKAAAKQD